MFRLLISCCMLCLLSCQIAMAQAWIPKDVKNTTILIERFKYQNPDDLELDLDEKDEENCTAFLKSANDNLSQYNKKLADLFKGCKLNYELAVAGKIDEKYEDTEKYRYVLKRDLFFGEKEVIDPKDKKAEELKSETFFAYRYYFYDREEDEDLSPYYFSGDQWTQVERLVFWFNHTNDKKATKSKTTTKATSKTKDK